MTETTILECKEFAVVIPLTQGKVARVALEDYAFISQFKWHAFEGKRGLWYARRWRNGKPQWEWMHRLIIGASKGEQARELYGEFACLNFPEGQERKA